MAKETTETTNSETENESPEGGGEKKKPEISAEAKKKLFEVYDRHDAAVTKAEAALAESKTKRAAAAKEIAEKLGPGPWKWHERIVVVRKGRGGEYHVRTQASEVEEIG